MGEEKSVQRNPRGWTYIEFVAGAHDHVVTRVWVDERLITGFGDHNDVVEFPVRDAWIDATKAGSLVLRPRTGGVVYYVTIASGYRGTASIATCRRHHGECLVMAAGDEYHSGQGALGATAWALVNADGQIEVRGHRSGRRVDDGTVAVTYHPDGSVIDLVDDDEIQTLFI